MKPLTQYITFGSLAVMFLLAIVATNKGWTANDLFTGQNFSDIRESNCPDHMKDQYGNCPPRSHRLRLGSRNYFDGGGK
jgi:hypothetical protein